MLEPGMVLRWDEVVEGGGDYIISLCPPTPRVKTLRGSKHTPDPECRHSSGNKSPSGPMHSFSPAVGSVGSYWLTGDSLSRSCPRLKTVTLPKVMPSSWGAVCNQRLVVVGYERLAPWT